jgi:gamma-glutamyl phosphate reductase
LYLEDEKKMTHDIGTGIDVSVSIVQKAKIAKEAVLKLANATAYEKNKALLRIAELLHTSRGRILAANEKDVEVASSLTKEGKLSKSLLEAEIGRL